MSAAPLAIALPLLAGTVILLLPRARGAAVVAVVAVAAQVICTGVLILEVWQAGAARYAIGGWSAPLGIELHVDGFAAAMAFITAAVALPATLYAESFIEEREPGAWRAQDTFWPCWLFLLGALQALYFSADVFNLYVTLELLTLASVALVVLANSAAARRAAMRYLLAAFLGSVAFLLAVALMYADTHVLDLRLIGARLSPGPLAWSAVGFACVGLAMKSALFPLHFWLPGAHSTAPAHVSAMLSGFVVAAAFYVFLRLWFEAFSPVVTHQAGQIIGTLGALAIVWGSLQAIRQQRLKVMIAYSTVGQIGYVFLVIPLAQGSGTGIPPWALDAWRGGIYLLLSHACAKGAMFLAAGTITRALGHDRLPGISGIASKLPISTYAFGIAGMSLIGLPPSGGFIGKWLLLSASIASGQWWWAVVIIIGGILTAGYVFLVLGQELSEERRDKEAVLKRVPRMLEYTAMALALAALLLGVRAIEPLELLRTGNPFEAPLEVGE